MAAGQTERGVPLSTLNPKFLHTNSTSHTWPFSAIAELIDNAYDPDVNAKQIWIDMIQIKDQECLTFMDNGNGLSYDVMHRMLSFGFSDKKAVDNIQPIGMYGNGFKSGSMRLGQDAIVLSKSENDLCVGMLSQTYLEKTRAEQIFVPIISIKKPEAKQFSVLEEHRASLDDILDHSPFNTQEELLTELQAIESTCSSTGTRIIIWNLRRTSAGSMEFDFTTDRYDIRIPSDVLKSTTEPDQRPERSDSFVPESDLSLRAYCSVLYLKPRMQINIRGQKVETQLISESLAIRKKYTYKPNVTKQEIPITFGYNENNMDQYGIMMYYKNRLIKAYHRVGCQLKANNRLGIGVIGVIECNFLEPTHNKQNFNDTNTYRNAIRNVAGKLGEYCKEIWLKRKKSNPSDNVPVEETEDKMTGELEETPREGTSGMTAPGNRTAKRAKPNVERELEMHMSLRSSTAPTNPDLHEKVKQLEEEKTSISAECENTKSSMKELQIKVQQLEEEKASISAECENAKSSLVKLVEEKASISAAHEETKTSLTELQTRVQQLEEEKASISAECENAKSRAQKQNGCPCERDQVNYQCNIIEEIMEQVLSNNGPTSH